MSAYHPPHDLDPLGCLGSGEIPRRFAPPRPQPPPPWYARYQTEIALCMVAALALLAGVALTI